MSTSSGRIDSPQAASTPQSVKKLAPAKQRLSFGAVSSREKSAKKSAQKTRTTVVNPIEIEWPQIGEDDSHSFLELVKLSFQNLKLPCTKVPLKTIRTVPKEKRSQFRKEWVAGHATEMGYSIENYVRQRSHVSLGVNCVSKALELDLLSAVAIEKNVRPQIITKLLIPLCQSKNIPVIAINGLNQTMQEAMKTRCIALGLKKSCATPGNHYYTLYDFIKSKHQV